MNSVKVRGVTPKGRAAGLVESELPDELLVYDLERHRADALNRTAAPVWKACDGRRTVGEIAEAVGRGAGARVDARVVWPALERLSRARPPAQACGPLRPHAARSRAPGGGYRPARDRLDLGAAGARPGQRHLRPVWVAAGV